MEINQEVGELAKTLAIARGASKDIEVSATDRMRGEIPKKMYTFHDPKNQIEIEVTTGESKDASGELLGAVDRVVIKNFGVPVYERNGWQVRMDEMGGWVRDQIQDLLNAN